MRKIIAYTDGSCQNHDGGSQIGSWGYVFGSPDSHILVSQVNGEKSTSSMKMELTAVIECLRMLIVMEYHKLPIRVYIDAKFVVDILNNNQIEKWKDRDWQGSRGKIKNQNLWQELDDLIKVFPDIQFSWVKGHNGDPGNEFIDKRIRKFIKGMKM